MVHIYGIDLLHYEYPSLKLEVRCGKGTYIRSLARDLGERLGCGRWCKHYGERASAPLQRTTR